MQKVCNNSVSPELWGWDEAPTQRHGPWDARSEYVSLFFYPLHLCSFGCFYSMRMLPLTKVPFTIQGPRYW